MIGETVGETGRESASFSGGDGARVGMREEEAVGSPVRDMVDGLVRVDVGIGVRLAVGARVSRLVCAVGGPARLSGRRQACTHLPFTLAVRSVSFQSTQTQ